MARPRVRSFLVPFVVTSAIVGVGFGSVYFASLHGSSSMPWIAYAAGSTLFSAVAGLPMALGLFLLLPRVGGTGSVRQLRRLLVALGASVPLGAAGWVLAVAVSTAIESHPPDPVAILPNVLGVTFIFFLVGVLRDMRARLREEELARERALRVAADAQLSSLESRIRPHFLFNALNSVLALIPRDPKRAEAVLERITGLLRASLQAKPSAVVPLADELALVTDYLEIERVRFEGRLRYVVDVPRDLEDVDVPAFSVQTLVENAVKHAVSVRRDGAQVTIAATSDVGSAAIVVSDDGPGFEGDAPPAGHGLDTLRGRLAALFGDGAALEIDGRAGRARVTIRVPARRKAA
jgi:hypothetical protein